ncbi:MAG: hypothetical protein F4X54_08590 [Chloroflexi bacterium]|nr:hypothetical protein [Chloroflexota bacterium]
MRVPNTLLVPLLAIALSGCASEPEPLTLEEYFEWFCTEQAPEVMTDSGESVPHGEYAEAMRAYVEAHDDVTPPEVFNELHAAGKAYSQVALDYAEQQPPDSPSDLGFMWTPTERAAFARWDEAWKAIDVDVRLAHHEGLLCLNDSGAQ